MTKSLLENFDHLGPHPDIYMHVGQHTHARVLHKEVLFDVCRITPCFYLCILLTRSQEDLARLMWQMTGCGESWGVVSVAHLALKLKTYSHLFSVL